MIHRYNCTYQLSEEIEMRSKAFDAIDYVNGAIKVGFTREQAEYQVKHGMAISEALVTKGYLSNEFKLFENKLIIKVGAMMVVQSGLILSVIGFLLHK